MSQPAGNPDRWSSIVENSELGLPVPAGSRGRTAKRLVARLCRPFLSRQAAFNRDLLAEIVAIRDSLVQQITPAHEALRPTEARLAEIVSRLDHHQAILDAEHERVERHDWAVEAMLPVLEKHGYAIDAAKEVLDDLLRDRELLREEVELAHQQSFARFHDAVGAIRTEMADIAQHLEEQYEDLGSRVDTGDAIEEVEAAMGDGFARVRLRLAQMDLVLDRIRRSLPGIPTPAELAALPSAFDNLYGAFEEALRGSSSVVKERVGEYLADIVTVESTKPVLDVGCGRGELLEVLMQAGASAYGVEINAGYAELGRKNGLDVRLADATEHISGLDERSLRAITAIQVAEHLTIDELIGFLDLAARAIEPGGLFVLETPNPENLLVGASSFYLDPTHVHPLPPALLAFLVEARGFTDVEVRFLERPELRRLPALSGDKPWADDVATLVDVLNSRLFNAQDYAVLARRP